MNLTRYTHADIGTHTHTVRGATDGEIHDGTHQEVAQRNPPAKHDDVEHVSTGDRIA